MRLAGQTKMGYYPLPVGVMPMISARLRPPEGKPFSILDPCAGEGQALGVLAHELCAHNLYAVELDEERGKVLKTTLPQANVLAPASIFGTTISARSFGLIYLNPPYDHEIGGGRTELAFLHRATTLLANGGVLALVCPEYIVHGWEMQRALLTWYTDFTVFNFPDHCREYSETVVLAKKRHKPVDHAKHDFEPGEFTYAIPSCVPGRFEKTYLTEDEVERTFATSPLRRHLAAPPELPLPAPPLALGTGHVAMLLAGGFLDGIIRPEGESPHVVRGTASKMEYVKDSESRTDDDGVTIDKVTVAEKMRLTVRIASCEGEIVTLKEAEDEGVQL